MYKREINAICFWFVFVVFIVQLRNNKIERTNFGGNIFVVVEIDLILNRKKLILVIWTYGSDLMREPRLWSLRFPPKANKINRIENFN